MNAGLPPICNCSGRISGVFGQKFGRKYSLTFVWKSWVIYSVISCFVFGQALHDARTSKSLGQKQNVVMLAFNLANCPLPERKSLSVGIVYAEDANALRNTEIKDSFQCLP